MTLLRMNFSLEAAFHIAYCHYFFSPIAFKKFMMFLLGKSNFLLDRLIYQEGSLIQPL